METTTAGVRHLQMGVGKKQHQIVIIGGGTAGITVASRLLRLDSTLDVAIIEPSRTHYYQPMWTLIAGGVFPKEKSRREESSVIPPGAEWIEDRVESIDPDAQVVGTASGRRIGYDVLVVAPGISIQWDDVAGLSTALGHDGVCSIYDYEQAELTWAAIRSFKGGRALFTSPSTPIKCGGAPQKIMYLADAYWRRNGVRDRTEITFASGGTMLFAVPGFKEVLARIVEQRGINTTFYHDLAALQPEDRKAIFRVTESDTGKVSEEVLDYDFIHVTPPMKAPDFIGQSRLAHADGLLKGWMNVDMYTLQNPDYPNVFGLGDVAGLPTAKTGAGVRKQAPVVVANLHSVLSGRALGTDAARYDGYCSCPIVTGNGKLVLAEFGYDNVPMPSFPFDQAKERRSMYLLKKYGLPFLYWNLMLRGRA